MPHVPTHPTLPDFIIAIIYGEYKSQSLIFKWNQMSMQDLETFRNIKREE
jgi:hypothetical protein